MLPLLYLHQFSEEADSIRNLILRLSGLQAAGLVGAVRVSTDRAFRVYADRYNYYITKDENGVEIVESLGPQVSRLWQVDESEDINNAVEGLSTVFDATGVKLRDMNYLYTEHSQFIWRSWRDEHLPKIKRRVFASPDHRIPAIVHLRLNDTPNGNLLEYVLETAKGIWHFSQLVTMRPELKEPETEEASPLRTVTSVGF